MAKRKSKTSKKGADGWVIHLMAMTKLRQDMELERRAWRALVWELECELNELRRDLGHVSQK